MYKIETHLHTKLCSSCGWLEPEVIVSGYKEAGYHAITVTDHFSRYNFTKQDWSTKKESWSTEIFLEGYRQVKDLAKAAGITVYRGAEVRFDGSPNDYLLFNYPTSLLEDPEAVFTMGLEAFYRHCQAVGAVLIQAHPHRENCTPGDLRFLDGLEVLNTHPRHDNENHKTQALMEIAPHLIGLGGSDCHQLPDIAGGGIMADILPKDDAQLAQLLRSKNFDLIGK